MAINVRESFGKLLGKVGRALRSAEGEAEKEIAARGTGEASSEEEEALGMAMGWNEAGEDNPAEIARASAREALNFKS